MGWEGWDYTTEGERGRGLRGRGLRNSVRKMKEEKIHVVKNMNDEPSHMEKMYERMGREITA